METSGNEASPWVRADLERQNPETFSLIREGDREEYIRLMKERAHWKGIANLVFEQMYQNDEACRAFFGRQQNGTT
jgi:hypothetical protein